MNPAPARARARQLLLPASALLACACLFALAPAAGRRASAQEGRGVPPSPPQQAEPEGRDERKAAVYGRAVYEGTTRPVRRAEVTLLSKDRNAPEYTALTDADGRFRVAGVSAGQYLAFVNHPGVLSPYGFVPAEEIRTGAPDFLRPELKGYFEELEVDGKEDKELTVYARRGAAVGGKVTYANGDPAVNLRVHIMRRGGGGQRLTKFLPNPTTGAVYDMKTDDRGRFRVAGLPPGEYVVGVAETADHKGDGSESDSRDHLEYHIVSFLTAAPLLMTYHPSVTRAEDARAVKVEAGDERDDVDITVADRELRTLAGVVRGRDDRRPVRNVTVLLARKADGAKLTLSDLVHEGSSPTSVTTDAEGRWRLRDIPDGEYTLHLTPPAGDEGTGATTALSTNTNINVGATTVTEISGLPPPPRQRRYAPARRELRVTADVSELSVELPEGARVRGSVVVEGGRPPDFSGIFLSPATPDANVPAAHQMPAVTVFHGEFLIEGVAPGRYRLNPHQMSGPNDEGEARLYLKAITWNGRDLMREPLDIAEGARVEGVRVVYARDPARLRVRVLRPGDRKPVAATIVFLLPPDISGWSVFYSRTPQCLTGADGSCEISTAPGDYSLVALPNARLGRIPDFEADLRRRAPEAPRLTLRAAENQTFELTLPEGN